MFCTIFTQCLRKMKADLSAASMLLEYAVVFFFPPGKNTSRKKENLSRTEIFSSSLFSLFLQEKHTWP